MPYNNLEQKREYNRLYKLKLKNKTIKAVEVPVEVPIKAVEVLIDNNFNDYMDYNIVNSFMHKQQFSPFTIWFLKIQEVNTVYKFKTDYTIFRIRYKNVMIEFLKLSLYPKIKYELNKCKYLLKSTDGLTTQFTITIPIK